ncbi:MAG: YbaK/prolyl-tRNA synthetase associated region [Parcubacteria group bacterium GW2011_GWD2_43_10]|uniref:YbaK/aminoacyl-tRNA synthetase-associated domain-containing protein n=5 Tax=Candidatus Vebleniibacteriota TaxID=1817921 RepID=A0A1G2Q3W3_9BACT|nr:MAG: YbaK/prolyl-tRNA synthetase associated region [Parcubacteria group bacterium GW2011_GWA2_42_80]KKS79218.1 MAG: YbaK/prolyl-tRNA synthetase associated region [Parcubacteria group bacterium GW2011_GWD1_42_9]KKS83155.1 MAG: YbaK/prolyl-tRNA synthetase associated region [Parcubacteria group bacterium GW2011_GWD2_43_10]KKS94028.1 MAG: YbaK/prolyl-tRNA synthetase associated region [Parcubacteria group bacterium GW2011_GWE2_43_12]KKT13881.1 MAG: YbaK/prolyl-tRNA synthetase associated region [P
MRHMKIPAKVANFLKKQKVKHEVLEHRRVYTAYDLAQTLKKKLSDVAKTLVVKVDKGHVILVLPASRQVDFKALKKVLGAKKVEIDRENVMVKLFKVPAGALSPFHGVMTKLPVYIDKALMKAQKTVVQAGSFEESVHMKTKDLLKAVEGKLANFSKKRQG